MTRLIAVNHAPVLPARNGGQQAVLGLALEMAAGWPTELVWTERKRGQSGRIEVGCRSLVATALPNLWRQRRLAKLLRHGLGRVDTDIGTLLCCAGNRRLIDHLLDASADGDVFMLSHPWLWPALRQVLRRRRAWLVYDAHNVEYLLKRESLEPSWLSRWAVERTRRAEAELVQRADLTLACTQRDADALAALAGVGAERLLVGSKGVAASPHAAASAAARAQRTPGRVALFVGSDHPPNNSAAAWIITALAPSCPDWRFDIAGGCGPASGQLPVGANVRVLGPVDDLQPLLAQADVALNPVDEGSGINMKLFDYLQAGLPVIGTSFGARGFEGLATTGMVLCERPGFAAALALLQADLAQYRRLSADAVACVHRHFTWQVIGERVRARVRGLLPATAPQ